MTKNEHAGLIVDILKENYPDLSFASMYTEPLQVLIIARLSARCTGTQLDRAAPALFKRFPTAEAFASATPEEIETYIYSCGLYKTKAKDIHAMCLKLEKEYNGIVPNTIEELLKLPGIGRKCANLVLGDAFNLPAIVVDVHCIRICKRLGLTESDNPVKIERELRDMIPPDEGNSFCHRLVLHGRKFCTSQNPKCVKCCLKELCKYQNYHTEHEL